MEHACTRITAALGRKSASAGVPINLRVSLLLWDAVENDVAEPPRRFSGIERDRTRDTSREQMGIAIKSGHNARREGVVRSLARTGVSINFGEIDSVRRDADQGAREGPPRRDEPFEFTPGPRVTNVAPREGVPLRFRALE